MVRVLDSVVATSLRETTVFENATHFGYHATMAYADFSTAKTGIPLFTSLHLS